MVWVHLLFLQEYFRQHAYGFPDKPTNVYIYKHISLQGRHFNKYRDKKTGVWESAETAGGGFQITPI